MNKMYKKIINVCLLLKKKKPLAVIRTYLLKLKLKETARSKNIEGRKNEEKQKCLIKVWPQA